MPHADAAANSGRAALLVAALGGQPAQLLRATEDFLHQQQREPAMPESLALVPAASTSASRPWSRGAGPTVLAFVVRRRGSACAAEVARAALRTGGGRSAQVVGGRGARVLM